MFYDVRLIALTPSTPEIPKPREDPFIQIRL
jgi:hypothetical protein